MATPDRWAVEFARLMGHVIEQYPFAQSIHLVVDHLISIAASPWSASTASRMAAIFGSG